MEHVDIPQGEIHSPFNWEFADATLLAAALISDASLVGKVALVLDTMTTYRLTSVAPVVWAQIIGTPVGVDMATQAELNAVAAAAALDATTKANAATAASAPSAHVGSTGAAHGNATTSVSGFMTAADKTKLDGVADNANNYTHPANHPPSIIAQDANNRFVTDAEKAAWNAKEAGGAVSDHIAALDPHPQYTTAAEAANAAPVQSVAGKTGTVTLTKGDVGLGNVDNTSDANKPVSTAQQTALDLKENTANKGVAGGYASLDGSGKVASSQLPSYVDDVLEAANFAALPGTGESGKIYVTLDDGKTWRWSGSAYVEISAAPGSTDAVPEGASNLYYTAQRVRDALLSGLSTATSTVISAADSVLTALGKLQAQVSLRAPIAGPTFTGTPTAPTASPGTNTTQLATTAFVQGEKASPAFTGNVTVTTNSTSPALTITQDGTGNALEVRDVTGDTTPVVVNAAGKVIVGHTASIAGSFGDEANIQITSLFGEAALAAYRFNSTTASGVSQYFYRSRGASIGTNTIVQSGDSITNIAFSGADGTTYHRAAQIGAEVDGTPGTNDMPGRLVFSTTNDGASSPTEKMRIANDGATTITTNSTSPALMVTQSGTGNALEVRDATGDTTPFVVDANGRLIAGHTASIPVLGVDAVVQSWGSTGYTASGRFTADSFSAWTLFTKSRSATIGGHTVVQSGDELGNIAFLGSDGTQFIRGAQITAAVDGTPGTNDMPGRLVFSTTADGASSPTERMRITSSGNVGIGIAPSVKLQIDVASGGCEFRQSIVGVTRGQIISSATDQYIVNAGSGSQQLWSGGSNRFSISAAGRITANNSTGLGYGTGSGGTVTQATSKSTAVTLNKPSGQIVMHDAALAAGAVVVFAVNNSTVAGGDTVAVSMRTGAVGNFASYEITTRVDESVFYIGLRNVSGVSLSEAVQIQFNVIKGATA